jgi:hypothetical protein
MCTAYASMRIARSIFRATGMCIPIRGLPATKVLLRSHQEMDCPQSISITVSAQISCACLKWCARTDRQLRALALVETHELKSLETELLKERRVRERARGGGNRMPALTLELKPPGRRDVAWRAKNRHPSRVALEETEQAPPETPHKPASIREEFTRAAGGNNGAGGGGDGGGPPEGGSPPPPTKPRGPSRKGRKRDRDRDDWER